MSGNSTPPRMAYHHRKRTLPRTQERAGFGAWNDLDYQIGLKLKWNKAGCGSEDKVWLPGKSCPLIEHIVQGRGGRDLEHQGSGLGLGRPSQPPG